MKYLSVEQGIFPEIEPLNTSFRQGSPKLKIRLDVQLENTVLGEAHPLVPERLSPFFPTLHAHACGSSTETGSLAGSYTHVPSAAILRVDGAIDVAHYMEHMMLDVLYRIGAREQVSGITLPLTGHPSQFLIFVECEDRGLGAFVLNLVMALMHQALYCGAPDPRLRASVPMARWLREIQGEGVAAGELAERFGITADEASYCLQAVTIFGLPLSAATAQDARAAKLLGPVLVVEDNEGSREILGELLAELGYSTILAPDGRDGLRHLCACEAGTVMLDVELPDVDGLAIARWLLETQPSTSLILMSGSFAHDTPSGRPGTAVRFLPKPFSAEALEAVLRTAA